MKSAAIFSAAVALTTGTSFAVIANFTETFNTNASNWLNNASPDPTAATYHATGGIDDSGYISFTAPEFTSSAGFGDPLQIMFRGNAANDASGDAFVGDWISAEINFLSVAVRHNYTTNLNFYARFAAGPAASLGNFAEYAIAPNTWTTITIPITNSNPPFASWGGGSYSTIFSNIQNLQLGLYLPNNTLFTNLRMDIDNVTIAVPEPSTYALLGLGLGAVLWTLRRRKALHA